MLLTLISLIRMITTVSQHVSSRVICSSVSSCSRFQHIACLIYQERSWRDLNESLYLAWLVAGADMRGHLITRSRWPPGLGSAISQAAWSPLLAPWITANNLIDTDTERLNSALHCYSHFTEIAHASIHVPHYLEPIMKLLELFRTQSLWRACTCSLR